MQKEIGKRIQEFRKRRGITQEMLAERLEISPHYLSALERGVYNIKLETLVKILNCLDCSADEIFCDVVNRSLSAKANELSYAIEGLDAEEKRRILQVVETMVKSAVK